MSRIYFGSKVKTVESIKAEFPKKEIVHCVDAELQSKSYSPFFDSNKMMNH